MDKGRRSTPLTTDRDVTLAKTRSRIRTVNESGRAGRSSSKVYFRLSVTPSSTSTSTGCPGGLSIPFIVLLRCLRSGHSHRSFKQLEQASPTPLTSLPFLPEMNSTILNFRLYFFVFFLLIFDFCCASPSPDLRTSTVFSRQAETSLKSPVTFTTTEKITT
jgi:hypothetical protein